MKKSSLAVAALLTTLSAAVIVPVAYATDTTSTQKSTCGAAGTTCGAVGTTCGATCAAAPTCGAAAPTCGAKDPNKDLGGKTNSNSMDTGS